MYLYQRMTMTRYKNHPTPDKDFCTYYTNLWRICRQVGINTRIQYTPEFERTGSLPGGAAHYFVCNTLARRDAKNVKMSRCRNHY